MRTAGRRRSQRTGGLTSGARAVLLLLIAVFGLGLSAPSPVSAAPSLVLSPTHDPTDASFDATYTADTCRGADGVAFSFDGAFLALEPFNPSCQATLTIDTAGFAPGSYAVQAAFCFDHPSCDPPLSATYRVDAPIPPVITVNPTSGPPGAGFTATVFDGDCTVEFTVEFFFDGVSQGSDTTAGCEASMVIVPPATAALGPHTVAASPCPRCLISTTCTIVEPPLTGDLRLSPTHGPPGQSLTATYVVAPTCGGRAQFAFAGVVVGEASFTASCRAILTFAPPAGAAIGDHTVSAIFCSASCSSASVARATYTIDPPPSASPTATPKPTPSPTATPKPTPGATPKPMPTPAAAPSATPKPTASSTATPTSTPA
ncbi:MAG: hypothetical protein FJ038_11535, partial [Chloroflexi bacterium]|nr:hypothetical protein [Chloroflexota bacterium]